MQSSTLGQAGEKVAANYLISQGYEILEANYFNQKGYRIGELDLVAKEKNGTIVFVEVKCRKGKVGQVVPEENITAAKLRKITKAAQYFLRRKDWLNVNWRVDAVAVIFDYDTRKASIRHIKAIRL